MVSKAGQAESELDGERDGERKRKREKDRECVMRCSRGESSESIHNQKTKGPTTIRRLEPCLGTDRDRIGDPCHRMLKVDGKSTRRRGVPAMSGDSALSRAWAYHQTHSNPLVPTPWHGLRHSRTAPARPSGRYLQLQVLIRLTGSSFLRASRAASVPDQADVDATSALMLVSGCSRKDSSGLSTLY